MTTIKSYTNIEQSKKLAEILPLESADMYYWCADHYPKEDWIIEVGAPDDNYECICAWSLAALFKYLSEIKPRVYTPVLFPNEGKWILQFVEYGHGNVCEVSYDNPIDACVAMIEKLNELNML